MVPNVVYDDPGPIMDRLGSEGGRYVTIAWDPPGNAAEADLVEVPAGWVTGMAAYYRVPGRGGWPARPAWEYATNAETISGRDGGLMPLRTCQEFFAAAVNPEAQLTRRASICSRRPSGAGRRSTCSACAGSSPRGCLDRGRGPPRPRVPPGRPGGLRPALGAAGAAAGPHALRPGRGRRPGQRVVRLRPATRCWSGPWSKARSAGCGRKPADPPPVEVDRPRADPGEAAGAEPATDGLLVLADPWYPQWRVEVDGKPAELLRVDHAFRGVRVPAGHHEVVFTYQDRALWLGAAVALATCLALAGLWAVRRRRPARELSSSPSSSTQ